VRGSAGFIIFDYRDDSGFKDAAIDVANGLLKIGQRSDTSWTDLAILNVRAGPQQVQHDSTNPPLPTRLYQPAWSRSRLHAGYANSIWQRRECGCIKPAAAFSNLCTIVQQPMRGVAQIEVRSIVV